MRTCAHDRATRRMLTALTSIKRRPRNGLAKVDELALARLLVLGAYTRGRAPHVLMLMRGDWRGEASEPSVSRRAPRLGGYAADDVLEAVLGPVLLEPVQHGEQ